MLYIAGMALKFCQWDDQTSCEWKL